MQDSVSKIQKKYWSTKQVFIKKFGRKEDDSLVASDAELDAKLDLFAAIYNSCVSLERILENYQDRIAILSQEENAMGRFLKECGRQDKTRAGKMMSATGKSLAFTAQQRLTMRSPLVRLYQEVETYLIRAIADTDVTVCKMEKSRTDYRGALLWMKEVSQKLDPDTFRQLEKFRKVQGHVKKTKMSFEKLKIDTLQKVDLLSASRCNMFSHALAAYQEALLVFWDRTAKALAEVSDAFKGYQYYEFTVVKELAETSKKLAEETGNMAEPDSPSKKAREDGDTDRALFYNPEWKDSPEHKVKQGQTGLTQQSGRPDDDGKKADEKAVPAVDEDEPLLYLGDPSSGDYSAMLDDLLGGVGGSGEPSGSFAKEWENTFGVVEPTETKPSTTASGQDDLLGGGFQDINLFEQDMQLSPRSNGQEDKLVLPSQLLTQQMSTFNPFGSIEEPAKPFQPTAGPASKMVSLTKDKAKPSSSKKSGKQDPAAWFSLFADLDPIANPDAIGAKKPQDERNC